jgi:hypothetical protein
MAKIVDTSVTEGQATIDPVVESSTFSAPEFLQFRDKLYTSRLLIIPGTDRSYLVDKAMVMVPASDTDAVKFLKANEEFEPLKE